MDRPTMTNTKIVAGSNHTLYLDNYGKLYSWGLNDRGQLGDSTTINKLKAVRIKSFMSHDDEIVSINCGDKHCAVLTKKGNVYVWGDNSFYQLGLDTLPIVNVPTVLDFFKCKKVVKIACGSNFTLAIVENKNSYDLYSWGDNSSGQLGSGDKKQLQFPTKVFSWKDSCTGIACGRSHSVAIINSNIWVWGDNSRNQLGLNNPKPQLVPHQLILTNLINADNVKCGAFHTIIKDTNTLWALGDNTYGQRGIANPDIAPNQVKIDYDLDTNKNENFDGDIVDFCCGMNFSIAVTGGGLYVWGDNSRGQLGFPVENLKVVTPTQPAIVPDSFYQVSAGSFHSLCHGTQGPVYGIGLNCYGQLGDNTQNDSIEAFTSVIFPNRDFEPRPCNPSDKDENEDYQPTLRDND